MGLPKLIEARSVPVGANAWDKADKFCAWVVMVVKQYNKATTCIKDIRTENFISDSK
jgi:hypothetical protein